MEKLNFTNEQMANYIKGDRNRLTTSVRNLLTAMRDILEPKEYLELVGAAQQESNFPNLCLLCHYPYPSGFQMNL